MESRAATGRGIWLGGVGRRRFLLFLPLVLALSACSDEVKQTKPPNALVVTIQRLSSEAVFRVKCNPPGGNVAYPQRLCETLQQKAAVMLYSDPNQACYGPLVLIHVSGFWNGKRVEADPDGCHGNWAAERLWMKNVVEVVRLSSGSVFDDPNFPPP